MEIFTRYSTGKKSLCLKKLGWRKQNITEDSAQKTCRWAFQSLFGSVCGFGFRSFGTAARLRTASWSSAGLGRPAIRLGGAWRWQLQDGHRGSHCCYRSQWKTQCGCDRDGCQCQSLQNASCIGAGAFGTAGRNSRCDGILACGEVAGWGTSWNLRSVLCGFCLLRMNMANRQGLSRHQPAQERELPSDCTVAHAPKRSRWIGRLLDADRRWLRWMGSYAMLHATRVPDAVPESRFRFTVKVPNYPVTPCCGVLHILDLSRDAECERHPWQQNESQILRLEKVMGCGSRRGAGFFWTCVLEMFLPPGRKPRVSARTFAQYATHGIKGGLGWGGDDDVPCTCTHGRCYASHGVGWGGDDDVPCTCTHGRCYASHGVGWGGHDDVPCTCTHGRCYASHGVGWGGHDDVPCTCTHGRCYASHGVGWAWWCSLHLHTWSMLRKSWGGVGMMMFLALAHMCDATQLMGWGWVGMMMFLALAHMCDATQLMGGGGWGWWCSRSAAHKWPRCDTRETSE